MGFIDSVNRIYFTDLYMQSIDTKIRVEIRLQTSRKNSI